LEIEPSKTKLLSFGRFVEREAKRSGQKPETFDFLGFTHYCGKSRHGHFKVKRRTSGKKYRAKLNEVKEWLRQEHSRQKKGEVFQRAKLKLVGHLNYYAITDNAPMCDAFRIQMMRLLFKWLNRQSQRHSYNWSRFVEEPYAGKACAAERGVESLTPVKRGSERHLWVIRFT